ncbi:MAG TPA: DUF3106 domain-containing protein [Stenotrophomonas sp.]|nr:DUF3106 domain-containing protein [Stenotrophomonas sp.]
MTNDVRRGRMPMWLLCLCAGAAVAQPLPAPLDETTGALPSELAAPALSTPTLEAPRPWAELDAAAREDVRARYAAWQALDPAARERIRQARTRLATLPLDQQRALRTRFDAMDRLHRTGWRLGPQLGRQYPALQPLFGYVAPEQRARALALLQSLDEQQLAQLAVISQRSAPQDRPALRDELLALAPSARAAWLRARVGR